MTKKLLTLIVTLLFTLTFLAPSIYAQEVSYEKFGRLATLIVKEDYPEEDVVDFEYLGREQLKDAQVVDTFQFEVMKKEVPHIVLVKIVHDPANNREFTLTIEEKQKS